MRRGCKDPGFLPTAVPFPRGLPPPGVPPGRSHSPHSAPALAGNVEPAPALESSSRFCLSVAWLEPGQGGDGLLLLRQWDVLPPYS